MQLKHLLLACSGFVGVVMLGISVQKSLEPTVYQWEKYAKKDRMDLAMEQELEMTKDPRMGTIPDGRLQNAINQLKEKKKPKSMAALSSMTWTERGPSNVSGRTRAILVDASDATNNTVWVGSVGGGLWKTTNASATTPSWTAQGELFGNLAVTTLAQAPASLQTMYFGTGEGFYNSDAIRGLGIWKTTDGGTTWNQLSSTNNSTFHYVQKIVINSTGTVFAATRNGGIQRSTDGGATWTTVLSNGVGGSITTRAADIEIGADGSLYAAMGLFVQDGIYKSTNNGNSWTKLTSGLPTSNFYRIELACAPSDANRVYAVFHNATTNDALGIYRSTNGGTSWTAVTNPSAFGMTNYCRQQAWYDLICAVDPNNADRVFIGGIDLLASTNGGTNWTQVSQWYGGGGFQYVHADQHGIVFAPGSSSVAFFGNDGGLYRTGNANATTPTISFKSNGYNVTQFYSGGMAPESGSNVMLAGAQDNGTQRFTAAGINSTTEVTGGDGAYSHIDQTNSAVQVSAYVFNQYRVTSNNWASYTTYNVSPTVGLFINPTDLDNVANILYCSYGAGRYARVTGIGSTLGNANVAVTAFGTGVVTTVKVSPTVANRVYFGLNNGDVVRVDNANATPTGTIIYNGASGTVSSIAIDPANESHILFSYSNYGVTSLYETTNGGTAWTAVEGDLPDMPVRAVLFAPGNSDQALIGTELGVWTTENLNGASTVWLPSNTGFANVRVDDLQTRTSDNRVMVVTHGRGVFTTNFFAGVTAPSLTVAPLSMSFTSAAGSQAATVTANNAWTASASATWISVSPASGSGNASATVSVTANTGTTTRTGTVTFTSGSLTQVINISQAGSTPSSTYAPVPYSTGFETGSFDSYWYTLVSSTTDGRVQVTNGGTPVGSFHAIMDVKRNNKYSTNSMNLRVNLSGLTQASLSFKWKEFADENNTQDGVYISSNGGSTFTKVYNLTGGTASYQTVTLDLDQLAASAGLTLSSTFVIRFQQRDNYPYNASSSDGIAIDDVNVTGSTSAVTAPIVNTLPLGNVQIAPNPFRSTFQLSVAGTGIPTLAQIFDVQGKVLYESKDVSLGGLYTMGATLPAGNYLVRIVSAKEQKAYKVVKQ